MKRQNLHLTVMSITIILAFALLSYGRPAVDRNVVIADSHVGRYVKPEPRVVECLEGAKDSSRIRRALNKTGGQIGRLVSQRGGQVG
jgi:hypothetical protein